MGYISLGTLKRPQASSSSGILANRKGRITRPLCEAIQMPLNVRLTPAMRSDGSAQLAPPQAGKVMTVYHILKNQLLYPLAQGFLWAVLKDWMVLLGAAAKTSGAIRGQQMRQWMQEWIKVSPLAKEGIKPA